MIMCSIGRQPSQSSQLSPSEPLNLQVRFRGLFRVVSKNKIPVDELLSSHSSGKQGKCLLCNRSCLADAELSTLEWSKSFDKFDVVLKFSQYAGVYHIWFERRYSDTCAHHGLRVPMFNCFPFIPFAKIDILAKLRTWAKVPVDGSLHDTADLFR